MLKNTPDWIQAVVALLIVGATTFSSYKALEMRVSLLEQRVDKFDEVYEKQIHAAEKLTDAVNELRVQVARLETNVD